MRLSAQLFCIVLLFILGPLGSRPFAAETAPALLKAKQEAETRGYIFLSNHDELVSRAKKEGRLNIVVSLSDDVLKTVNVAFRKKYPFIETRVVSVRGNEIYLRLLEELRAGLTKNQDVNDLVSDYYTEYLPYQKKFDMFGMAQHKILQIPLQMIDPNTRNVVAVGSALQAVAYNKQLIAADKVPNTWEDFLKPEFRDKKFMVDIRPLNTAALVPAWGLERTLDFARKIAAQKPLWIRGHTAGIAQLVAGEHALHLGPNFDSILRAQSKDKLDRLAYKIPEPVPTRLNEAQGVLNTAEHPYAALLWLEFLASPEGQKVLDQQGPYEGSVFVSGTVQEQATRGKKRSVVDWDHFLKTPEYQKKIVEAYGFPRADDPGKK
jgi:ABC-type Fe3+ transport system substrate-binding protein